MAYWTMNWPRVVRVVRVVILQTVATVAGSARFTSAVWWLIGSSPKARAETVAGQPGTARDSPVPVGVLWCLKVIHGRFQWVSMGFNGFQWVSMGFNGFQWVSMGFNGFQWVSMGFNGFQWVSMGFNGFQWVSMGFNGFQWVSMGFNGFQWVSMGFNGFQWVSMGFNGFQWVSKFNSLSPGFDRNSFDVYSILYHPNPSSMPGGPSYPNVPKNCWQNHCSLLTSPLLPL